MIRTRRRFHLAHDLDDRPATQSLIAVGRRLRTRRRVRIHLDTDSDSDPTTLRAACLLAARVEIVASPRASIRGIAPDSLRTASTRRPLRHSCRRGRGSVDDYAAPRGPRSDDTRIGRNRSSPSAGLGAALPAAGASVESRRDDRRHRSVHEPWQSNGTAPGLGRVPVVLMRHRARSRSRTPAWGRDGLERAVRPNAAQVVFANARDLTFATIPSRSKAHLRAPPRTFASGSALGALARAPGAGACRPTRPDRPGRARPPPTTADFQYYPVAARSPRAARRDRSRTWGAARAANEACPLERCARPQHRVPSHRRRRLHGTLVRASSGVS